MSTSLDFGAISAYKFAFAGAVTANTNTAAIDTAGFDGLAVVTSVATSTIDAGTGANAIKLQFLEGDDTNIANAVALDAKFVVRNPEVAASNTAFWSSVKVNKRYLFAQLIPKDTVSANIHVIGALGYPDNAPTTLP